MERGETEKNEDTMKSETVIRCAKALLMLSSLKKSHHKKKINDDEEEVIN